MNLYYQSETEIKLKLYMKHNTPKEKSQDQCLGQKKWKTKISFKITKKSAQKMKDLIDRFKNSLMKTNQVYISNLIINVYCIILLKN